MPQIVPAFNTVVIDQRIDSAGAQRVWVTRNRSGVIDEREVGDTLDGLLTAYQLQGWRVVSRERVNPAHWGDLHYRWVLRREGAP